MIINICDEDKEKKIQTKVCKTCMILKGQKSTKMLFMTMKSPLSNIQPIMCLLICDFPYSTNILNDIKL
jgi:hypothetical protein